MMSKSFEKTTLSAEISKAHRIADRKDHGPPAVFKTPQDCMEDEKPTGQPGKVKSPQDCDQLSKSHKTAFSKSHGTARNFLLTNSTKQDYTLSNNIARRTRIMARRGVARGNVGEVIRKARIARGLTQVELAEQLGYESTSNGSTIRRWESGSLLPPLDRIRELAAILDIPIDSLIP